MERRSAAVWLAGLALAGLALGFGPALAQMQKAKTCSHEGAVYKPGDKLVIAGKPMVCDGATGSWVPDKG